MTNISFFPRSFNITQEEIEKLQFSTTLSVEPPPKNSLFQIMWDECLPIAEKVLATDYFQHMIIGNLDPQDYGRLINQDSFYCFNGQFDYELASQRAQSDKILFDFYNTKAQSYKRYNVYFTNYWGIKDRNSIFPNNFINAYVEHEKLIASNEQSPYLMCAMLPCEYLWFCIARGIDNRVKLSNIYRFWVEENLSGGGQGAYLMGNILEKYRNQLDINKCIRIYMESMKHELNVFTNATLKSEFMHIK